MTAIIDYGVGNLFSLRSSLASLGLEAAVTRDPDALEGAERIILPGVGAFGDAMQKLRASGMAEPLCRLAAGGKPVLGICLGMQMLFDRSFEYGEHQGLGLIPGEVLPFQPDFAAAGIGLKVPHIGWNSLDITAPDCPILKYTRPGDYVYYVHSYHVKAREKYVAATSRYGLDVTGVVQNGKVFGTQFHPEKSGRAGLGILRAFGEVT